MSAIKHSMYYHVVCTLHRKLSSDNRYVRMRDVDEFRLWFSRAKTSTNWSGEYNLVLPKEATNNAIFFKELLAKARVSGSASVDLYIYTDDYIGDSEILTAILQRIDQMTNWTAVCVDSARIDTIQYIYD